MKKTTYLLLSFSSFLFIACDEVQVNDMVERNPIIITLNPTGIDYTPLKGNTAQDLLAIQIYEVRGDDSLLPYAKGLFSSWDDLSFKGYNNTKYKVVASLVKDASEALHQEENTYGLPFEMEVEETFNYSETAILGLVQSTATLANAVDYTTPNIDRYFGYTSKVVSEEDHRLNILLKRMTFGVKMGEGLTSATLKIEGAPEVVLSQEIPTLFSLSNFEAAYSADESGAPYKEEKKVAVLLDGVNIFSGSIDFYRNKQATLTVKDGQLSVGFDFEPPFEEEEDDKPLVTPEDASAYITKVISYIPAPGQFVNKMPDFEEGDTQEIMNQKVLESIGNNKKGIITLGGYGGSVIVGFDHTIVNVKGKRDFRVLGNGFYNTIANADGLKGGGCEPGIIRVAYDKNKNGLPDAEEWFEIAGSAHRDVTQEAWYQFAVNKGATPQFIANYELTYTRPSSEPDKEDYATYIPWSDNQGQSGFIPKNNFHRQSYFPSWIDQDLTIKGSILPQNGVNTGSESSPYISLMMMNYGYADNVKDSDLEATIDISWAVDAQGNEVELPGVDFIQIYTGVNQINGMLGECSTEVKGIEDLHVLKEDLDSLINIE